ncbi:hypothetical protein GCM10027024_12370 [Microbacterium insulae]
MPDEKATASSACSRRERLLEAGDRGVPQPGVDVRTSLEGMTARGEHLVRQPAGVDSGKRVRRGQVQGEGMHSQLGEIVAAGVDGEAIGMQCLRRHATMVVDPSENSKLIRPYSVRVGE